MEVWKSGGGGLTTIKHESSLAIYVMKTIKKKDDYSFVYLVWTKLGCYKSIMKIFLCLC
jgi:hypothetical protein